MDLPPSGGVGSWSPGGSWGGRSGGRGPSGGGPSSGGGGAPCGVSGPCSLVALLQRRKRVSEGLGLPRRRRGFALNTGFIRCYSPIRWSRWSHHPNRRYPRCRWSSHRLVGLSLLSMEALAFMLEDATNRVAIARARRGRGRRELRPSFCMLFKNTIKAMERCRYVQAI
jgi:hypothetical protein